MPGGRHSVNNARFFFVKPRRVEARKRRGGILSYLPMHLFDPVGFAGPRRARGRRWFPPE